MTHPDPHHLLGGVAPDILTPEERKALYTAALEDQALFDALGDEEALRELLADPAVRARLREALTPKVVPLWRRPALLGVAASLLLAGLATLAVRRNRVEVPKVDAPAPLLDREAPAAAPGPVPAPEPPLRLHRAAPPPPPPAPAMAAPAAPQPAAAAEAAAEEKHAESQRREAPRPKAQAPQALPKDRELQDSVSLAPGVAAGAASGSRAKSAVPSPTPAPTPVPPPVWTLEELGADRLRLTVFHPATHTLVLIRRSAEGASTLAPMESESLEGDRRRTAFIFTGGPGVAVDLYLVPPQGPVAGTHIRVFPRTHPSKP